jgi:hypothetical protein
MRDDRVEEEWGEGGAMCGRGGEGEPLRCTGVCFSGNLDPGTFCLCFQGTTLESAVTRTSAICCNRIGGEVAGREREMCASLAKGSIWSKGQASVSWAWSIMRVVPSAASLRMPTRFNDEAQMRVVIRYCWTRLRKTQVSQEARQTPLLLPSIPSVLYPCPPTSSLGIVGHGYARHT